MAIQILFIGTQIVFDSDIVFTDDAAGCICCGEAPVACSWCEFGGDDTAPASMTVTLTGSSGWPSGLYDTYVLDFLEDNVVSGCVYEYIFPSPPACRPSGFGYDIEIESIGVSLKTTSIVLSLDVTPGGNFVYTAQTWTARECNTSNTYTFLSGNSTTNCGYPDADVTI